VEANIFQLV